MLFECEIIRTRDRGSGREASLDHTGDVDDPIFCGLLASSAVACPDTIPEAYKKASAHILAVYYCRT